MNRFQPTRASPPIKSSALSTSSRTENSVVVAPELRRLSTDDIEILDAVIRRAGPSATTFFPIFKAYSDVLKERGLDPQEVVYYGKLLKLGTLKGKNWGEKWAMVKSQVESSPPVTPTLGSLQSVTDFPTMLRPEEPSISMHMRRSNEIPAASKPSKAMALLERISKSRMENPTRHVGKPTEVKVPAGQLRSKPTKASIYATSTFISDDDDLGSSQIPPSYRSINPIAATRGQPPARPQPEFGNPITNLPLVSQERKKRVDLDDAWKNIKLEEDENFADKYREEVLLARCWGIWRQGFLWIKTTHQQIDEARDKLMLKQFMQRWRNRQISRQNSDEIMVKQFQTRMLTSHFRIWQGRLKQRRQIAWRNDMRQKMKSVKNKADARVMKETWFRWKRALTFHRAGKHYHMMLLMRYHERWKTKLVQLDDTDRLADHFREETDYRTLQKYWNVWKQDVSLRHDEHIIARRVQNRILVHSFDVWKQRHHEIQVTDAVRNRYTLKNAMEKWKRVFGKLKVLERRSEKHLVRSDELLLLAVVRIWRARMRGKRYEYFRSAAVIKNAFQKWKTRITKENARMEEATVFFGRSNVRIVATSLALWRQVQVTHRNASAYAVQHYNRQLFARTFSIWHSRLQEKSQAAKVARWANRFFATRRAWNTWVAATEEKKRQQRLKSFEAAKVREIYLSWKQKAQRQQYLGQCQQIIQHRVDKRILINGLVKWTNRVIEVKSQELDITHQYNISLQRFAFQKWRFIHCKHVEQVSLLENYLLVKQEDLLRQTFHRWLTAKRAVEHRRINHQRKEAQLRQVIITAAWEKWRERFKEERLRPLEYEVILENQRRIMAHTFKIWFSKTNALPAVHFHSNHVKAKFFKQWKDAVPNALRAKRGREVDRIKTLARFFAKWTRAQKTKITLKAVARAKYLRLPAATSRPTVTRPIPLFSGLASYPRRVPRDSEEEDSQDNDNTPRAYEPSEDGFAARSRRARSPRGRSERSNPRSEYEPSITRQPSPVRSIISFAWSNEV